MLGRGRGNGAVGGAAASFCSAVESAFKGVDFLGDPKLDLAGTQVGKRTGTAFSEERREDVTSDFLSVAAHATALAVEGSIEPGVRGTSDVCSPVNDDDALRNPRFKASLVMGGLALTPVFTLPFVCFWYLTGDGRHGALMGLEGPATGRVGMDDEEGCLERRDEEALEGTGMRDLEGEL